MAACPACERDVSGEFAFCPYCGAPLAAPPPVRAARERKVVSVVFCDLVGFTAASERADPEEVAARVAPVQRSPSATRTSPHTSARTSIRPWPLNLAGLAGAQAFLVEAGGDLRVAAERHAAVGAQWRTLGARLEQAYSVLGQGRCLTRLDDPAAESTLQEARRLFAAMGAHARVEDCDALLVRVSRLSS